MIPLLTLAVHALQVLGLWAFVTFLFFLNALALNVGLSLLFFFLTLTFSLLAGGETSLGSEKAACWFGVITAATAFYVSLPDHTSFNT